VNGADFDWEQKKLGDACASPFVFGLKKSYFFFFFAAFFAGFFAAFFLVAMLSILPFHFHGTLRYRIIAICSLYRVIEINSQAKKKTYEVALLDDVYHRSSRRACCHERCILRKIGERDLHRR
jgi:hypothetical protein